MFVETLGASAQALLAQLGRRRWMREFYLAGGTGAALQLGHRVSEDLDFFTREPLDTRLLIQQLKKVGTLELQTEAPGTVLGIINGTRVSFLAYDYRLLEPMQSLARVRVASLVDIGLMKLTAVSQRGSRRDFVDLLFICQQIRPLTDLLALMPAKFDGTNYNLPHILRSLVFFEDAEAEPMPRMLKPVRWSQIKRFFEKEISAIARGKL